MIDADAALAAVKAAARALEPEDVPPAEALDRVLAADHAARRDLPGFDNSAMDGYAVRAADYPRPLKVLETVRAGGKAPQAVEAGTAVPVMTGAPLPPGADAVVMRECVRRVNGTVELLVEPRLGEHVRRAGEDVRAGAPLLSAGTRLRAYELALLCAQGFETVPVVRRPRVSVLPTGDELGRGVLDSNGPALAALLGRWGAEAVALPPAPDEPEALRQALLTAIVGADLVVVTGGVSAGDFDLTRPALEELGMEVAFHKVAIKPGKPLLFGTIGKTLIFGLPGNPVAALVCAEEFVRPAVEGLSGRPAGHPSFHLRGILTKDYPAPKDRRQYLFCSVTRQDGHFWLTPIRPQGSAMLGMACRAQALAVCPGGRVGAGDELDFRWLK